MSTSTPQVDVKRVKLLNMILSYPFFINAQPERADDGNIKPGGRLTYSCALIAGAKTPETVITAVTFVSQPLTIDLSFEPVGVVEKDLEQPRVEFAAGIIF